MKKYLLFLMLILLSLSIYSQQVNKNYVVVEIGTGAWCQYCPGAAMGADDLVENGHQVAIIENHNGDPYAYAASNARNTYYAITGYPTAWFNGLNPEVGGSHTQSMYNAYLDNYNNAIAVMSDFTMDLSATHVGLDYDVTIELDEVGTYAGENLFVHLALTESHIEYAWQGQTELNFVSRAMYPDQNGTAYTGGQSTINLSFTANADWDLSNCELVAFVQDNSTKQILQSDKLTLAEPTGTNNVALTQIKEISDVCEGSISPSIKVKNFGSADITSLTIEYSVNSGATTGTFNWTGDAIPFNAYAVIDFDEITFDILADNTIDFNITQVNGATDEDISDNTGNTSFAQAPESSTIVNLVLHTDNWGSECSWNIKNSAGSTVYSGGPYGNYQTVNLTFYLGIDCYTFNIIDSYGDGGGSVTLEDSEGMQLYYTNGAYGSGESQSFTSHSVLPELVLNPADGSINVGCSSDITITFNQPVRKIDDSPITDSDIASFISLTDPSKAAIPYTGTINADKTIITVNPDQDLSGNTVITTTIAGSSIESYFDDAVSETVSAFTTVSTSGIEDIAETIDIYPNPASDFLEILNADGAKLSMYDISGKQIFRKNIINNLERIDISNINSGIYVIAIEINGKLTERKLTIVK